MNVGPKGSNQIVRMAHPAVEENTPDLIGLTREG